MSLYLFWYSGGGGGGGRVGLGVSKKKEKTVHSHVPYNGVAVSARRSYIVPSHATTE